MHPSAAVDQTGRGVRDFVASVEGREVARGHLYALERCPQVVPERSEQQVAGLVYLCAEEINRFCERLVDRLIETDDIAEVRCFRLAIIHPPAQDACSQSAILSSQLSDVEATPRPQKRMGLCRSLRCASEPRREPHRFRVLRFPALRSPQIGDNSFQDLLRVVSQSQRVHPSCGRQVGSCKCLPPCHDPLHVTQDKVCQSHGYGKSKFAAKFRWLGGRRR